MARIYSWNAYESDITGPIDDSTGTIIVTSAAGLTAPCYLAIDPDDPTTREFVRVTAINTNTLTVDRALEGSSNPLGSPHDGGAKIRAVPVHQWLNDIFTDIEQNTGDLGDHETDVDPHPQYLTGAEGDAAYVNVAGDSMTGPLSLPGDPAVDAEAARKKYVDDSDLAGLAAANAYSDGLDHDHDTPIAAHAGDADVHHARYEDSEAQALIDTHAAIDDAHHSRYTDAEAIAAVDDGTYLKLSAGGTQTLQDELRTEVVRPRSDNAYDLGSASLSYRDIFAYNIKDEGGTTRLNLNGNWTAAGSITAGGNLVTTAGRSSFEAGASGQAAWRNTVSGMEVILGTNAFAPSVDGTRDLGAASLKWDNLHVENINGIPIADYLN